MDYRRGPWAVKKGRAAFLLSWRDRCSGSEAGGGRLSTYRPWAVEPNSRENDRSALRTSRRQRCIFQARRGGRRLGGRWRPRWAAGGQGVGPRRGDV